MLSTGKHIESTLLINRLVELYSLAVWWMSRKRFNNNRWQHCRLWQWGNWPSHYPINRDRILGVDVNVWGNNYLKKLSIKYCINFVFAFILLSFFLLCIYQNSTDQSLFKQWCKKIYTREDAWKGNPVEIWVHTPSFLRKIFSRMTFMAMCL